jgi:hypothetical protein
MSEQLDTPTPTLCPHCGGNDLYSRRLSSAGSHGPHLLQGLGGFLHYAEFDVVVCASCGLTRFFAEPQARQNVKTNASWKRL